MKLFTAPIPGERNFCATRDYAEYLSAHIKIVVCILCATGARHRCSSLLSVRNPRPRC